MSAVPESAGAPSTGIAAEYLMTLHAPIAGAPQQIDETLTIFHSDRGWVVGPRIKGRILSPTGDWLQALPGGSLKVDARMTIATEEGALIHAAYGGVIRIAAADFARMAGGETLRAAEMYFITAPTFRTAHPAYAWLNHIQAVGKATALRGGAQGYVQYDLFAVG
ncbi:MAG: DUF3237 domain-containing protein [Rhodospirillaceae bacterium]|nr:DUF3237 domain-containing protein [Rhodospirillaceae bacterium]